MIESISLSAEVTLALHNLNSEGTEGNQQRKKVHTEQYFHVKFEAERRKVAAHAPRGEGTIAGAQTVFHRPASSGVCALICHLELARIGVSDVTRELAITPESRMVRQRAAVAALLASLIKPAGAQRNTQAPHILECRGVATLSRSYWPAPMLSPLSPDYREEIGSVVETLNRLAPGSVERRDFEGLAEGAAVLEGLIKEF